MDNPTLSAPKVILAGSRTFCTTNLRHSLFMVRQTAASTVFKVVALWFLQPMLFMCCGPAECEAWHCSPLPSGS
eukprot:7888-Amphidinium_carterae.2